jgi:undecaprenyl-diphosphatase
MNCFDHNILLYLNHLAHQSPILTKVIVAIYADQLKFAIFVALLWWGWFDTHYKEVREKIAAGLVGSVMCVGVVRLIILLFPFRVRPLGDPLNGLNFPIAAESWVHWSSFPSDTATLFFFLTICLFSVSRWLGCIALVDTIFLICFPRVFVGVHYPTDILGGALLGIAAGWLITRERVRNSLSKPMLQWMQAHPASFYASAFLVTFLLANTFFPVARALMGLRKLLQLLIH